MPKAVTAHPTMDAYQEFIALSRYSRWLDTEQRRESWSEVVNRYLDFMSANLKKRNNYDLPFNLRKELFDGIFHLEILPSMRCIMMAGAALERCNVGAYNCSYLPVDHVKAFDETMYILMSGTGVGFSVERQYVSKLPIIMDHYDDTPVNIVVEDSRIGWAKALRILITSLYIGRVPTWDLSLLRPAGARLKTTGGRSSGPRPLNDLFEFTVSVFKNAKGRKLNSLEAHDIMCKIGEVVVVGGVRRSALISLSNLSDLRMREAKMGEWFKENAQRALANNSVCYTERPDIGIYWEEFLSLYKSKSGERGIFNREASVKQAAKNGRRNIHHEFGTNPCSEIILRPYQFCNLSEIVVRATDTAESLKKKTRLATILGTFQSTLTDFKYLRPIWRKNTEEECLLGVSMTGILDNIKLVDNPELLTELKDYAISVNKELAHKLGVKQSTAITCVKPSGTVSQLVDASSGIHPRHAAYYVRTVRADNKDPMTNFLIEQKVPHEPCASKPEHVTVFSFPQKAPHGAMTRKDLTALEHLRIWKTFQDYWCEHKPSITINIREKEWLQVCSWVWDNFDQVSGIAFLPYSDHTYRQAPYQDITKEQYEEFMKLHPSIDWSQLPLYEKEDTTTGSQELACSSGVCEVVDLVSSTPQ